MHFFRGVYAGWTCCVSFFQELAFSLVLPGGSPRILRCSANKLGKLGGDTAHSLSISMQLAEELNNQSKFVGKPHSFNCSRLHLLQFGGNRNSQAKAHFVKLSSNLGQQSSLRATNFTILLTRNLELATCSAFGATDCD
jgi:hypothetical protein